MIEHRKTPASWRLLLLANRITLELPAPSDPEFIAGTGIGADFPLIIIAQPFQPFQGVNAGISFPIAQCAERQRISRYSGVRYAQAP